MRVKRITWKPHVDISDVKAFRKYALDELGAIGTRTNYKFFNDDVWVTIISY